jgi:hypothetical protein
MNVPGKKVETFEEMNSPGCFRWSNACLMFVCPCGCESIAGVAVGKDMDDRGGNHPVWQWNGDREKPTITPSIQLVGGCCWHGFLTDGVFKSC